MSVWSIILCLLVSVMIELYAGTRVHSTKEFAVAGRSSPLPVVTATVPFPLQPGVHAFTRRRLGSSWQVRRRFA